MKVILSEKKDRVKMRIVPIPNQSDNYAYLLIDDASNKAAAVDPYDVPKVTAAAESEGVQIVAGITTHHHMDHSGGNKAFVWLSMRDATLGDSHLILGFQIPRRANVCWL